MALLNYVLECTSIQLFFRSFRDLQNTECLSRKPYRVVYERERTGAGISRAMNQQVPIRPRTLVILVLVLLAVICFAWVTWQFDQSSRQSERHTYYYTIDLSYNTTIENVTLVLPVPELNSTPFFVASLLNGTAYGVSPDWNLSIVSENGTPMLAIRAERMAPEYHRYPIAIEPGKRVLPTTLVPGHEYLP